MPVPKLPSEILRSKYEAINRRDVETILDVLHPELLVLDSSRPDPTSEDGLWHGKEGGGRFLLDWAESFDDTQYEPVEMTSVGEVVLAEVVVRGRGRGSGILVENRRFHVATFRDDKVIRFEVYADREEAESAVRRAAGS